MIQRYFNMSGQCRIHMRLLGLHMVFRPCNDNMIHKCSRDPDPFGVETVVHRQTLSLGYHDAAAVFRHRQGKRLQDNGLVIHSQVPVLVGDGAPDKRHIYRERFVVKLFLAVDIDQGNQVLFCNRGDLASLHPRIHISTKPDRSDDAYFLSCYGAPHLADHALRQKITLYFISLDQIDHIGRRQCVPADQPFNQTFMAQMRGSPLFIIAAGAGMNQGDILRVSRFHETGFNSNCYFLGPP